ncbi:3-hydroxyacyl-CoA dehydrogenase [Rhodovulum sulfidophilum]|uniref:Enoyl-CoA hydratase/isomerase family protein n=1 Tax=Rhodovulum visakhapatnamense TaxID=364297 RepID=A0ABS1RFR1_9RHOB|nr:FAD-dependent oxidoreductase [Rhodovulum visakhapatnamense]MBL3568628.1 enoyl-CoA hydratase/isomerase family protein [Rhodovulum visakhapatnamense]MBL3578484.1 enoyl-CoA hydratase/isomerase family protein [Rhodovulum visakhapatnamense]OLS43810.1 3-hydroxyacyl-CoA dehydrogenase [Rhodovulum sulfidophilum]
MSVLTIDREGEIAVAILDNPPVNAISAEVRCALWQAVETLDADPGIRAVVLVCAGRSFIAGADVKEFGQPPVAPHLPDLVARIEAAAKPWTAAIHGAALGGGLEIALGCRFRLIDAEARVGFPEVGLGIIPGASGTVRTPRLAGIEAAVEMVTSGKPVPAPEALRLGLVDAMVTGDLRGAAVSYAASMTCGPLPEPVSARPVETRPDSYWSERRAQLEKAGEAAPLRALEAVRRATEVSFDEAMAFERATFLALRDSPEAAALRHVFFAERAALRPAALKGVAPRGIASVGVVGGGTMGAGIAAALAMAGIPVTLIERDAEAAARAHAAVSRIFEGAAARGKLTGAEAGALSGRLVCTDDYAALGHVDLAIEAVFEDLAVKRAVFDDLARVCRPDAILATNTSYLDPRRLAEGVPAPERLIGLHFFSPAHVMKLLEIVPLPGTAPEVLATAFDLARRLGKMPVRAGICEGFIGNRILKRYRAAAEDLLAEGVPVAAVDAAMRGFGFRMGPFEAQDLGGLDIAFLQREAARAEGRDVPETLADILVRAGRKGQKTGGGWYDYPEGGRMPVASDAVARLLADRIAGGEVPAPDAIAERLVGAMADEGATILAEGIADSAAEIDLVEIHGYGFPRSKGGPMHWTGRG